MPSRSPALYPDRHIISDDELAAHLVGEIAIAVRYGNGCGRSRWLDIDIDARAPERIPLLLEELRRLDYGEATICTKGNDAGRVLPHASRSGRRRLCYYTTAQGGTRV